MSLLDVRAANDIVIHYDFDRDGWAVESPTVFSWDGGGPDDRYDEALEEVAFIPAFSEAAAASIDALNE